MNDPQNESNQLHLREFQSSSDFDTIADIRNQSASKHHGTDTTIIKAAMVENFIAAPERLRIAEINGKPIGFIFVLREGTMQLDEYGTLEEKTWLFMGPTSLPEYEKTEAEERLLDWLISYARKKRIGTLIRFIRETSSQAYLKEFLASEGFREELKYYIMTLEMTEAPPKPKILPAGLKLVDYQGEEDFSKLWSVLTAAFDYDQERMNDTYERSKHIFESLESPYLPICVEIGSQRPIGTIATTEIRTANSKHGFIATFGVIPSFQRKGIGSRLMERALDHFWNSGVKTVQLSVRAKNRQALRIYERFGFRVIANKTTAVLIKDL
ncbi:MAG: GNAT family N-acetyltransferase [Candidatus Hodarchaeota archaeon]